MDVQPIIDFLNSAGLLGGLLIVIVTGAKRLWVFGREFDALERDRDEWKDRAIGLMSTADRAVSALEKKDGA